MIDASDGRDYSTEEILRLLRQVSAEQQPTPQAPVMRPRPSIPDLETGAAAELSIDEILQKIQREIADERPVPAKDR